MSCLGLARCGTQPQPNIVTASLRHENELTRSIHISRFNRAQHVEDERSRNVSGPKVDNADERLALGDGECSEIGIVREDYTPFRRSDPQTS